MDKIYNPVTTIQSIVQGRDAVEPGPYLAISTQKRGNSFTPFPLFWYRVQLSRMSPQFCRARPARVVLRLTTKRMLETSRTIISAGSLRPLPGVHVPSINQVVSL